jgi:asparagine synthase (glutamine-hydrolysing)
LYDGPTFSYSIGFKDDPWTELPLAKILSEKYQTTHFEYEIDGSEINFLPEIIRKTGDPFQESGLMVNHSVMRMVARSETNPSIILGGDGNDQHFGTFGREMALNWRINKAGFQQFQKLYEKVGHLSVFDKDNILFRIRYYNRKVLDILEQDAFGFQPYQLNKLLRPEFKHQSTTFKKPDKFNSFDEFFTFRNYFVDIQQMVNEVILFKASKMASLFQNQLTFPYMSTDMYNWLKHLPREQKFKGSVVDLSKGLGVSKYLHKNYLKSKLPEAITQRKKQGGFVPLPLFFKDEMQRKKIIHFIRKSDAVKALFIPGMIDESLNQYEQLAISTTYWFWQRHVKAFQLFNLLVLCTWWEMFINQKQISTLQELID